MVGFSVIDQLQYILVCVEIDRISCVTKFWSCCGLPEYSVQ